MSAMAWWSTPPAPQSSQAPTPPPPQPSDTLEWPPGCAGGIAHFIHGAAPRPVKEIAIAAALAFLAGVCGRAYRFEHDGLNLYLLVLAESGTGKEWLHGGAQLLMTTLLTGEGCEQLVPAAAFLNADAFASGPALKKACAEKKCFVLQAAEFGRTLKQITKGKDSNAVSLFTAMTELYSKSGTGSRAGGMAYSNRENNIASAERVALSFAGESTQATFYEAVDSEMLGDGSMSRMTVIEYSGDRPPRNRARNFHLSDDWKAYLRSMLVHAVAMNNEDKCVDVRCSDDATSLLDAFDQECDDEVNSKEVPSFRRQMLVRAHLKAQRLSALLAVADNFSSPCIGAQHVAWSLQLVRRDMQMQTARHRSGDVGRTDDARVLKLHQWLMDYHMTGASVGYGIPEELPKAGVVPHLYFQRRTSGVTVFESHPLGSKRALNDAIGTLIDGGYLLELPKATALQKFDFGGRCYAIVRWQKE